MHPAGCIRGSDRGGDWKGLEERVNMFIFKFGLVLGGVFLSRVGVLQGWDGAYAVVSGLMLLWLAWSLGDGSAKIDVSVRNKIVAQDGNGRYLVEAKTSRQITGPRPHVIGNLPASLTRVKKGLWVVDSTGHYTDSYKDVKWEPVNGNMSIEPRGSQSRDLLDDMVQGYDHTYIKGDE